MNVALPTVGQPTGKVQLCPKKRAVCVGVRWARVAHALIKNRREPRHHCNMESHSAHCARAGCFDIS